MRKLSILAAIMLGATLVATAPAPAAHLLRIVNGGHHVVTGVSISGVNRRQWGPNLLRGAMRPGQSTTYSIGEGCLEDLRVVYQDGHVTQSHALNTCRYNLTLTY